MRLSLLLCAIGITLLVAPSRLSTGTSDKERLFQLRDQIGSNLTVLRELQIKKTGKLSFAYLQKLEGMNLRFNELKANIKKLDNPTVLDKEYEEAQIRLLMPEAVMLAQETANDIAYFNASNETADGEVDVDVTYPYQGKEPPGWRVVAVGEYDRPSKVGISDFIDQLCNDEDKRKATATYKESSTYTKQPIRIRVVTGTVYFWTRHPEHCRPRTEPHIEKGLGKSGNKMPYSMELTAPGP